MFKIHECSKGCTEDHSNDNLTPEMLREALGKAPDPVKELIGVLEQMGNPEGQRVLALMVTQVMVDQVKLIQEIKHLEHALKALALDKLMASRKAQEPEAPSAGNATRYGSSNGGYI